MPHGITQCYLLPDRCDFPAFALAAGGTRFSDPRRMQGLTRVYPKIVYPPVMVTYLRNNRTVSWPGIEPTTESYKSNVLTTRVPPSHLVSV